MGKKARKDPVNQMTEYAKKFLSENLFTVIKNPEESIFSNIFEKKECFYFIRTTPELNKSVWILMYISHSDVVKRKIYFVDPEGLLLDKISEKWFSKSLLKDTEIYCCHSWFVHGNDDKAEEYTSILCAALAKLFSVGGAKGTTIAALEPPAKQFLNAVNFNLEFTPYDVPSAQLAKLLTTYPERVSALTPKVQSETISTLLKVEAPQVQLNEAGEAAGSIERTPQASSNSSSFFEGPKAKQGKPDIRELKMLLLYYSFGTKIIESLESSPAATQDEILKLCSRETFPFVDPQKLELLKAKVGEILDKIPRASMASLSK